MQDFKEMIQTDEVSSAATFVSVVKWSKIILALFVMWAYFSDSAWLVEAIVISVVVSLIVPLGFFDVFIQKLLKYNTQMVENRQFLNAKEANEHFGIIYKKIDK